MPYVCSTCLRDHVRTCQKRAKVLNVLIFTCQGAKFLTWRVNIPKSGLIFLLFFKRIIFFNILNIFIRNIFYTLYKHIIYILQHRCFPVRIAKFLRTVFLKEHSRWLLPRFTHYSTRKHCQKKREETLSKKVFL